MGNCCCSEESREEPNVTVFPASPKDHYGWNVGSPPIPQGGNPYMWTHGEYGSVPHNAVKAGVDKNGETIFVGRAYHENDVVPAKIVPSHGGAYVPWGGAEHKKDHYEVLCADNVSWQSASNGAVPDHAVAIGSTREGETLFIGRVMHDGTLTPGKVHPSHGTCYIPYAGQELSFPDYEVLVIHHH